MVMRPLDDYKAGFWARNSQNWYQRILESSNCDNISYVPILGSKYMFYKLEWKESNDSPNELPEDKNWRIKITAKCSAATGIGRNYVDR